MTIGSQKLAKVEMILQQRSLYAGYDRIDQFETRTHSNGLLYSIFTVINFGQLQEHQKHNIITRAHMQLSEIASHIKNKCCMRMEVLPAAHSDTSMRVQLGRKYHGRLRFSHLSSTSGSNVVSKN